MNYRFLIDVATPGPAYREGETYELEQPVADQWVANGWCELVDAEEQPAVEQENSVAPKRRGRKPKAQSEDLL